MGREIENLHFALSEAQDALEYAESSCFYILRDIPDGAWAEMREMSARIKDLKREVDNMLALEWYAEMIDEIDRINYDNECRADAISY